MDSKKRQFCKQVIATGVLAYLGTSVLACQGGGIEVGDENGDAETTGGSGTTTSTGTSTTGSSTTTTGTTTGGACSSGTTVTYTNPGHAHTTITLTATQVQNAVAGNYMLMGGGHSHTFSLSAGNFSTLAAGGTVTKVDLEGHNHSIDIECV